MTAAAEVSVRPAGRGSVRKLADALARAFYDDPAFEWMLPDDETRRARSRRLFATVIRAEAVRHGAVDAAWDPRSGDVMGGAIWFPPGSWPAPAGRQLRSLPGYAWALGRRIGPAAEMAAALARAHPRSPHWYLYAIGVPPAHQGRGVGGALLRSRLARVDRDGAAAYLESSKPGNVPLYEHFGFRADAVPPLPGGVPALIPMSRRGR